MAVSGAARPSTGPLLSALGLRGGANSFARMGELRAAADHMQIEPVDRGTPARRWQCPRRSALFTWLLLIMSPSSAFLALSAPVLAQGVSAAYSVTGTVLLVVATVSFTLVSVLLHQPDDEVAWIPDDLASARATLSFAVRLSAHGMVTLSYLQTWRAEGEVVVTLDAAYDGDGDAGAVVLSTAWDANVSYESFATLYVLDDALFAIRKPVRSGAREERGTVSDCVAVPAGNE